MDENEITQRLRDAGDRPVPDEVRASHVSQMHAATPASQEQKRFGRVAVAAAAFVGFAVGSTGFAMAGALPDPAQQVAHEVLAVVQVDVEDPKNRGQCVSAAARANPNDEEAKANAKAQCPKGKPDHAGPPDGVGKGRPDRARPPAGHPHEGDPCKGPPPWAGQGGKGVTPAEKQAFQTQRAACAPDGENEIEELEDPEIEEPREPDRPEELPQQPPEQPAEEPQPQDEIIDPEAG